MPPQDSPAPTKVEPVLPPETITWLWERLTVRYGRRFVGIWDGVDLGPVHQDWAYELRNVSDEQLQWAVENLPEEPPAHAGVFRRLCRDMPDPNRLKLPAPVRRGIPPNIRAALQALAEPDEDPRPQRVRWAESYIAKFGAAIHLTPFQKETLACARAVLRRWEATKPKEEGNAAPTPAAAEH
jgi:hypothetical protein